MKISGSMAAAQRQSAGEENKQRHQQRNGETWRKAIMAASA
jgi:hypothetical protein